MKGLVFLGGSQDDLPAMPAGIRHALGIELMRIQFGGEPMDFKPMPGVGSGACEIRVRNATGAFRVVYVAKFSDAIHVLHAFRKKTQKTTQRDLELAARRYKLIGVKP